MKTVKQCLLIFLGLIMVAYATGSCFLPNKIVSGGVSGMSTILYHFVGIPVGISYGVINAVLLAIGFKMIGKDFTIKTLVCTAVLSVLMDVASKLPPLTNDIFLATIPGCCGLMLYVNNKKLLDEGKGVYRLAPAWVPRSLSFFKRRFLQIVFCNL